MWGFFEKPPHAPKNFKKFLMYSRIVCAIPTDSAQIACWNSATPNTNVFVLKRTKTALCYTAYRRIDSKVAMLFSSKSQIFEAPVKMPRKSTCVAYATRFAHNLFATAP